MTDILRDNLTDIFKKETHFVFLSFFVHKIKINGDFVQKSKIAKNGFIKPILKKC